MSHLPRRTMLRGMGVGIGLPWLEAMGPLTCWAQASGKSPSAPNRMAFLYMPNGTVMSSWTPKEEGPLGELPEILQEVREHAGDLNVISGLDAAAEGGSGQHARAMPAFLTGVVPLKTEAANYRAGVSVDQVAASMIGDQTRLESLEIGIEENTGFCDFGFHCVYKGTMSWRSATQPMIKEVRPQQVFERLFGGRDANRRQRDALRKSLLDYAREDSARLSRRLGAADRRRMDEYLASIRDIEQRIARAASFPELKRPDLEIKPGIPKDYDEHCRLMCDLLVLAFQSDITRIATFALANELSELTWPEQGVKEGHHGLTHAGESKHKELTLLSRRYMRHYAYLLDRMNGIREGDGTLLDHSMIAFGSAISDGQRHDHDNLPILLAGKGGGTLKTGRHLRYPKGTRLTNLWLAMLERVDVRVPFLGDSTGVLQGLG